MTEQETRQLCYEIQVNYPNWKPETVSIVKLWTSLLKDETFEQMHFAFCAFVRTDTKGFPPTIGQLLDILAKANESTLTEGEAWAMVSKAIRSSAYYSDEEFKKLPPEVQRAVGAPSQLQNWATDENYNESVAQSNFLRSFRNVKERNKEERLLPTQLRQALIAEVEK